ncbi:MAG: hypothetical protein ACI841_005340 [Planctomycetota bacterium]|jgi:hypothetical protein
MTLAPVSTKLCSLSFAGIALALAAASAALIPRIEHLEDPHMVAMALAIDLTLLLPAAFLWLVARPRGWSGVSAIPVAVLGYVLARALLPAQHLESVAWMAWLFAALEIVIVTVVFLRVRSVMASAKQGGDGLQSLRVAALSIVPVPRLAAAVASELAILFYGLASWRRAPHTPAEYTPIFQHRASQQGALVFVLLMLTLVEGVALHLLLARWSPTAAWILSALTAYGGLWLVADYRATMLRPVLIGRDAVQLRAGLRWSGSVPREKIVGLRKAISEDDGDKISLTLFWKPKYWVMLERDIEFEGPYGFRKSARVIGITPDDASALREAFVTESDAEA